MADTDIAETKETVESTPEDKVDEAEPETKEETAPEKESEDEKMEVDGPVKNEEEETGASGEETAPDGPVGKRAPAGKKKQQPLKIARPKSTRPKKAAPVSNASSDVRKKKSPKTHPRTLDMIIEAIEMQNEAKGSSVVGIRQYILANYLTVRHDMIKTMMRAALQKGLDDGLLTRPKGQSSTQVLTGRYKVTKQGGKQAFLTEKKNRRKQAAKPKPVVKKASPKKVAPAKPKLTKRAVTAAVKAKAPAASKKAKSPAKSKAAKSSPKKGRRSGTRKAETKVKDEPAAIKSEIKAEAETKKAPNSRGRSRAKPKAATPAKPPAKKGKSPAKKGKKKGKK